MTAHDAEDKLRRIVEESRSIAFFGGAGTSTESGIPDFRSASGLYSQGDEFGHPPETILSRSFFLKRTAEFYRYYFAKMIYPEAKPNAAHLKLAEWERQGRMAGVITQNIDGLHQLAGSRSVVELHGSVHRNRCMSCGAMYDLDYMLRQGGSAPSCGQCRGIVKPDVVLYEEPLNADDWERATRYLSEADTLIVGGTSLTVHPAAGLVRWFQGKRFVIINMSPTPFDASADLVVRSPIGKALERL